MACKSIEEKKVNACEANHFHRVKKETHTAHHCECCAHDDDDGEEEHSLPKIFVSIALFAAAILLEKLPFFRSQSAINPVVLKAAFLALYFCAYILTGLSVLKGAVTGLLRGKVFGEEFLMGLATLGAIAMGEYSEAVAVMILFQIGEFFEDKAVDSSRESITELMDIRPDSATVKRGGKSVSVKAEEVEVGEIIEVRSGEKIVLDDNSMLYSQYEREQILIIAGLAAIAINNTTLIEQATTDIMTRLKLKNYFFNVLEDKIDTSVNEKSPLSVLMLDIDFFKKFNDTYGHACGDYVLQAVSKIISDAIRGQDLAGRYGGEEFVVMLFNTNAKEAMIVAERIRKTIENYKYEYEGEKLKVTISIGVSSLDLDSPASAKQLVEFADRALYQSKQNGRNQVSLATKKTPPVKENSNIFFKKQKKSSASKASSVKSHTSAKKSPQINTGKTSSKKRKTVK